MKKTLIDVDELRENFQQGKMTCCGMTIDEIIKLKKENAELKAENVELYEVNKILQWKVAETINLKAKIEELEKEIERLKARCAEIYFDS